MMKWNLFAIMILVALFAVSCGDEDPSTDVGAECTTAGEMKCEGDLALTCQGGSWTAYDCAEIGKTCVMNGTAAECSGGTTDNGGTDNATDNGGTDTDTPATGNCGNDKTDTGEACDGDAKDCTTIAGGGYTGGFAECKSDCSGYDETGCIAGTDSPVTDSDTPATGKTCLEINQCTADCTDQACVDACVASGTTEAQAQYNAVMTCVSNNCATECGSGGTNETCNACASEKCPDEMDACFTVDVAPYGNITANAAFTFFYDGSCTPADTCLGDQVNGNQAGLVMNSVFGGTYGSGKPVPGVGGQQTLSLAMHTNADNTTDPVTPASVVVMMQSQTQTGIVNPVVQMGFPSDAITPGQLSTDASQQGSAYLVLLNSLGNTSCLLAYSFGGTVNVTAASNTTAPGAGTLNFDSTKIEVYYPKETPMGDISGNLGTTQVCPKE
ncbi:MAG TPA: hypothetical protein PLV42_11380 [bacterium]|nr:hypothetical protein [bacterium]